MKNHTIDAIIKLAIDVAKNNPEAPKNIISDAVIKLGKFAVSLQKRYANQCSYEWACTDKYIKGTARLELKAQNLAKSINCGLAFQTDPRGWPLIVTVDNKEHRIG